MKRTIAAVKIISLSCSPVSHGDDLEAPATDRITIELPPLEEDKTLDDTYEADTEPH